MTVSAPTWQQQVQELGFSFTDLTNATATLFAALSVGCIIFVPMALRLGRRPIYILTALICLRHSRVAGENAEQGRPVRGQRHPWIGGRRERNIVPGDGM
jgi:hypothetical protein